MPIVTLPNNWRPRHYQRNLWRYLENGGLHAEWIVHRRGGKDEVALHRTACAAFERVANYWHMLPEYAQARKAIWDAVNPHTGKRRIDEAFPRELRARTNAQEMLIEFKNGSIWQVAGSDNYDRLVGSSPAGVVFSEWALADPAARAFIRPMLLENGGWQLYITTPRGRNHAYRSFNNAKETPGSFAELLTVEQTGVFDADALERERLALIADYGEDEGESLFRQEYYCSFDAAIMGAFWAAEIERLEQAGRVTRVEYDDALPVHTAWDLGYTDDTAIWFWQQHLGEVRVIDCHASSGKPWDYYAELVKAKGYQYGNHWLPHDARAKTLASGGRSIEEMARHAFGMSRVRIVPNLSVQDGIQAARRVFAHAWFDESLRDDIEALRQYRREWDDKAKAFKPRPLHDWTSHRADAFRMLAVVWKEIYPSEPLQDKPKFANEMTFRDLWALDDAA